LKILQISDKIFYVRRASDLNVTGVCTTYYIYENTKTKKYSKIGSSIFLFLLLLLLLVSYLHYTQHTTLGTTAGQAIGSNHSQQCASSSSSMGVACSCGSGQEPRPRPGTVGSKYALESQGGGDAVGTSGYSWMPSCGVKNLKGQWGRVGAVCISRDKSHAASGSTDARVRVWELTGRKPKIVANLDAHHTLINTIALSPDGSLVVSGSVDSRVIVCDVQKQRMVASFDEPMDSSRRVVFSPDGTTIAFFTFSTIKVIDTREWKLVYELEQPKGEHKESTFTSIAYSPNSRYLAAGAYDGRVFLYSLETGNCIRMMRAFTAAVMQVRFLQGGIRIAVCSRNGFVCQWQSETGEQLLLTKLPPDMFQAMDISPNGKFIVSGSYGGAVQLWSLATRECELELWDPNVKLIETSDTGNALDPDEQLSRSATKERDPSVSCVAHSADGSVIVSGSDDQAIRIWVVPKRHDERDDAMNVLFVGLFGPERTITRPDQLAADGFAHLRLHPLMNEVAIARIKDFL
jgi:WD40 repeat protein